MFEAGVEAVPLASIGHEPEVPDVDPDVAAKPQVVVATCANPHGIQIRQDLQRMVTADYAAPREIVSFVPS